MILVLLSVCWIAPNAAAEGTTASDSPGTRAAALTPEIARNGVLLPGQLRLAGCSALTPNAQASNPPTLARSGHFQITAFFECLAGIGPGFERDLVVNVGGIDIARIPITTKGRQPGEVFKQTLDLYVPHNTPLGATALAVGVARENAPGEDRTNLTDRMAQLVMVNVTSSPTTVEPSDSEKAALWQSATGQGERNLLSNGDFEQGFIAWTIHENNRYGKDGWPRVMSISLDNEIALHGKTSLRIDFGGGQDVSFYYVHQIVGVKPSTAYQLSYFVKTEEITSKSFPFIAAVEQTAPSGERFVPPPEKQQYTGTHAWTLVKFEFTTLPTTRQVSVRVHRSGSGPNKYEPERYGAIGGSVWFDGVQLTEVKG